MQVDQMNKTELSIKSTKVIGKLRRSEIGSYIDASLDPPDPFRGSGKIKLIVVGQDPTVQDPEYKKKVKVVLLLNQPGGLRTYLGKVCKGLDIDLDENIYATNLLKNFFTRPPDRINKEDPQFYQKAADYWIPLLREEIEEFKNVPVLTLGEPVLNCLTKGPDQILIRYSWGFEGSGQYGRNFGYIKPSENVLGRVVFPFPHIPGLRHKFYRQQMDGYLTFMKEHINP
jgi:uracil-DNA glycosylase